MSETKSVPVNDPNIAPVRLAALEQWEGGKKTGIEGYEVSFTESAPDMRNRLLYGVLVALALLTLMPFLLLLEPISTFAWIGFWMDGELDQEQKNIGYIVLGGSAVFLALLAYLRPPYYGAVNVLYYPASDEVIVRHKGRESQRVRFSEVRNFVIEKPPALEEWEAKLQMKPTWGIRRQVNKYRLTDCVFMITGRDMAANMIEVGAFMTRRAGRGTTAMKARAALDMAWQRAARAESPLKAAQDSPPRRRRRKKIE